MFSRFFFHLQNPRIKSNGLLSSLLLQNPDTLSKCGPDHIFSQLSWNISVSFCMEVLVASRKIEEQFHCELVLLYFSLESVNKYDFFETLSSQLILLVVSFPRMKSDHFLWFTQHNIPECLHTVINVTTWSVNCS